MPISRKVAVTLPEFSFCFSKNVLTQSCNLSHGEMVPDIFVCWPGGGGERVTRAYTVEVQTASVFYTQSLILSSLMAVKHGHTR